MSRINRNKIYQIVKQHTSDYIWLGARVKLPILSLRGDHLNNIFLLYIHQKLSVLKLIQQKNLLSLSSLVKFGTHQLLPQSLSVFGYFYNLISTKTKIFMQNESLRCKYQTNVGITQFLSKGKQIDGIIKYLISDFIVNQVDTNNKVVMFKSKDKTIFNNSKQQQQANDTPKLGLSQQKRQLLLTKLSEQAVEALSTLYDKLDIKEKVFKWSIQIPTPQTKQQRTDLHQFIRENLPFIESKNDQGKFTLTYAKVFKRFKKTNQYLHFKLMKSNIDTPGAIFKLSKILNVNPKLFNAAGLKDKRGITTQRVSLFNCQPELFNKFYKVADRTREIWIGETLEHQEDKVHLGDLNGNKFALCIRFIKPREDVLSILEQNLTKLKENGFINYFGMQRFGSRQVGTHHIGIQVIKKNFKQIIQMLILQQTRDQEINKLKRQIYQTKNWRKGQSLPNKFQVEKNLFHSLDRHGQNYGVVFETLPRTNRSLYGHALQSYLWNKIVSKRISLFGTEIKIGDFVAKNKKKTQKIQTEEEQENLNEGEEVEEEDFEIQKITQQNIKNYTPYDLLIPLYGSLTIQDYPAYLLPYVQEQLHQLGLQPSMFTTGLPKSLMLSGGYRKMINVVQDLTWNVTNHNLKDQELQNGFYYNSEEVCTTEGKYFSLRVRFILSKSCYATMAVRQLLKSPSSFQHQEVLNKLYKAIQ